jgi:Uncharacterized protein conserved in bacteria
MIFHCEANTVADQGASNALIMPNAENLYKVTRADLPLSCPMPSMMLWNSHPRVYLPIEKTGKAKCPYCGAGYALTDFGEPTEDAPWTMSG